MLNNDIVGGQDIGVQYLLILNRAGTGWKEDARSSDPGGLPCFMFWPPVASKVTLGRPRPFVEAQSLKLKVNNTGSNHAWASSLLWNFNFGSVWFCVTTTAIVVQLLNCVQHFETPLTAARQAPLSSTEGGNKRDTSVSSSWNPQPSILFFSAPFSRVLGL